MVEEGGQCCKPRRREKEDENEDEDGDEDKGLRGRQHIAGNASRSF
jgi:hypothetical protein